MGGKGAVAVAVAVDEYSHGNEQMFRCLNYFVLELSAYPLATLG